MERHSAEYYSIISRDNCSEDIKVKSEYMLNNIENIIKRLSERTDGTRHLTVVISHYCSNDTTSCQYYDLYYIALYDLQNRGFKVTEEDSKYCTFVIYF